MNIDKIIFKIKDTKYIAVKCYGYKYLSKYYFTFIEPKRYKRYYPYWKVIEDNKIKKINDNLEYKRMFDYLTRHNNNFIYECYDHKNNLINKDFNFYKYITIKDMKLNKDIKDLSLASELVNELSMKLLIK